MMARRLVLLAALGVLLGAAPSDLEGLGETMVIGGNLASARARALQTAQQDCLSRAVALQLGRAPDLAETAKLTPLLVRNHHRWLRTYRVLDEGQQGERFQIRLACAVDEASLRRAVEQALAISLGGVPAGGAWLVVVEGVPEPLAGQLLERARRQLQRSGLALAAPAEPGLEVPRTLQLRIQLESAPAIRGLGWPARHAVLRASRGAVALGGPFDGYGADPSASVAEQMAAEQALDQTLTALLPGMAAVPGAASTASVQLGVRGLPSVAALRELQRWLEQQAGPSLQLRWLGPREAHFELQVSGGAAALAAGLGSRSFQSFSIGQQQIAGGALWLTINAAP